MILGNENHFFYSIYAHEQRGFRFCNPIYEQIIVSLSGWQLEIINKKLLPFMELGELKNCKN